MANRDQRGRCDDRALLHLLININLAKFVGDLIVEFWNNGDKFVVDGALIGSQSIQETSRHSKTLANDLGEIMRDSFTKEFSDGLVMLLELG